MARDADAARGLGTAARGPLREGGADPARICGTSPGNRRPIALFSVTFPSQGGGIAVYAFETANELWQRGLPVVVVAGSVDPSDLERDSWLPFRVMRFPRVRSKVKNLLYRALALAKAWLAFRPALVLATDWYGVGTVTWALAKILRFPYAVVAHGNEVLQCRRRPFLRWIGGKVMTDARAVVAVSRFTEGLIRETWPDVSHLQFIPNGVSPERLRADMAPEQLRRELGLGSRPVILTLARLVRRKGHDQILRALPGVIAAVPDVIWVVAGEGPMAQELEGMVAQMGVGDHVRFLGRVEEGLKGSLYNLCDVYAMVSRMIPDENEVEGFGITYLEASACGKPIVAGRSGGVEDAVVDGETGLLVDPLDTSALASALIRLLTDREFARRLGEAGRRRVLETLTWDRVTGRLLSLLSKDG